MLVTKTYLRSYLWDSSEGSDSSDNSDKSYSSDSSDITDRSDQKTFSPTNKTIFINFFMNTNFVPSFFS